MGITECAILFLRRPVELASGTWENYHDEDGESIDKTDSEDGDGN